MAYGSMIARLLFIKLLLESGIVTPIFIEMAPRVNYCSFITKDTPTVT